MRKKTNKIQWENSLNFLQTFTGKERDSETGFSYFGARYYDSDILTGWLSVDPMADKYPSLSPYAYCGWNPIKLVDPDGRIVRISDNYVNGIENIAKIAATSLGATVISHLMARGDVYTLNSTFFISNSSYNPKNRDVNYVKNPWYNEIPYDGGILNSMIAMGHELFHAFDHSKNIFNSANAKLRKNIAEPRAVSFANYLREAYSLSPLRKGYGNIKGNFNQFVCNEKITNFTALGSNKERTIYGFSYAKTTTIVESYKTGFLGFKIPDKTKTETSIYYMTVSMDRKNNVSFQIYNNKKAYKEATYNW